MSFNSPASGSLGDWESFDRTFKADAPIRYFITRTLREEVLWPVSHELGKVKDFFKYRYTIKHRYHTMDTGLKPNYYDTDTRLMHTVFQSIVDYVEVELAWQHFVQSEEGKSRINRFRFERSIIHGLQYLDWEIALIDPMTGEQPNQARTAAEIREIYMWWTLERSLREPEDEAIDLAVEYDKEDNIMLHRVIDIRRSLWT